MRALLWRFLRDEQAEGELEYAVSVLLIVLAALAVIGIVVDAVRDSAGSTVAAGS